MRFRKPRTLLGWMMLALPVLIVWWIYSVTVIAGDVRHFLIANGVKGL